MTPTLTGGPDGRTRASRSAHARRTVIIVAFALVGLLIGGISASQQTTRHESTVRLLVGPIGGARTTLDAAGLLSRTYADLLSSRSLVSSVASSLGVPVEPDDVEAHADQQSRVIVLTVRTEDPSIPQDVADGLAAELIGVVEESVAGEASGPGQVRVLDEATTPEESRRPTWLLMLAGTSIGAALGYAVSRSMPWGRSRGARDVLTSLGLPIVKLDPSGSADGSNIDEWDFVGAQLRHLLQLSDQQVSVAFVPVAEDPDLMSVFLHIVAADVRAGRTVVAVDAGDAGPVTLEQRPERRARRQGVDADELVLRAIVPHAADDDRDLVDRHGLYLARAGREGEPAAGSLARLHVVVERVRGLDVDLLAVLCPAVEGSPVSVSSSVVVDHVVLLMRAGQISRSGVEDALEAFRSVGVRPAAIFEIGPGVSPGQIMFRELDEATQPGPAAPSSDAPGESREAEPVRGGPS